MAKARMFLGAVLLSLVFPVAYGQENTPKAEAPARRRTLSDVSPVFTLGNLTKLLQNAKVQKELGLTSQQMDEIKSIAAGGQSEQKEVFDKNSPISMAEVQRMKGLQALILDVDARHQERIMKVLSDSQQARVLELRIQTSGARSLLFEDVAQHLALTREQRRSVNALIMDPGNPLPSKNELEAKAKSLLTNEQVEEFEKMKGKKIDLEPEKRD